MKKPSRPPAKGKAPKNNAAEEVVQVGRVVANYGHNLTIETPAGETVHCYARRLDLMPVVGDEVEWASGEGGRGRIIRVKPRRSELRRALGDREPRVLAANIDQAVIMISPTPLPDRFLIDRYLLSAYLDGLKPFLILNKTDLIPQDQVNDFDVLLAEYESLGCATGRISCVGETGMAELEQQLANKVSILVGQSGVGKSSLTLRLIPQAAVRIGELSAATGTGRHTTTNALLYHLPGGGDLVDSPGVRDLKLWPMPSGQVEIGFPEFAALGQCRFNDCSHRHEPDCAIRNGLADNRITQRRYQSYLQLYDLLCT